MRVLVLDIGGTFTKYACMDEAMRFLERGKIPTPQDSRESLIEALGQIYDGLLPLDGIALAMPGIIDPEQGCCRMGGALLMGGQNMPNFVRIFIQSIINI